jgi:hypothetical protein
MNEIVFNMKSFPGAQQTTGNYSGQNKKKAALPGATSYIKLMIYCYALTAAFDWIVSSLGLGVVSYISAVATKTDE